MDTVLEDLLTCLDNPGLALLQWDEVFSVVEVSAVPNNTAQLVYLAKRFSSCKLATA